MICDLFIYNHVYPHARNEFVECFKLSFMILKAGSNLLLAS
jgi:hypothetical protein